MDSQESNISEQLSPLWPQKQEIKGSLGFLRICDPVSNQFSQSTCILLNQRTVLTQGCQVFNRYTCSYLTQLQLSMRQGQPFTTYRVADVYIVGRQIDKNRMNQFKEFHFVVMELDKKVEKIEPIVCLNKQLNQYEEKVKLLQNYINKVEDHFSSLMDYVNNVNQYTSTQDILQSFLQIQIQLYGQYSLNTVQTRKRLAYAYEKANEEKQFVIDQKIRISKIYEQNDKADSTDYANILQEIGFGYIKIKRYSQAIQYLEQALHLYQELDYPSSSKQTCAKLLIKYLNIKGVNTQAIKNKYGIV